MGVHVGGFVLAHVVDYFGNELDYGLRVSELENVIQVQLRFVIL